MVKRVLHSVKKFSGNTFSALHVRNYRLYFTGQAISLCGTWMQTIAQSWLVLEITGSGAALGIITALQFLPVLILGPWGGVLADRFPKRTLLFMTQSAAGILALGLGILVATEVVELWMVGVFALLLGVISALDNPTRQTFITEMVQKDHMANAVALNATEVNLARLIGPAIAGALIATAGIAWCFAINGLSYIAVLAALYFMRLSELTPSARVARTKGQLKEGFRYVAKTPLLRDALIMVAILGTLTYEFNVSLPIFARFTFSGEADSFAALTSMMGAGSIAGALFSAHRKKRSPMSLARAALFLGLSVLSLAASPSMFIALCLMTLVGFFSINFLSQANVFIQTISTAHMRGRVMALWAVAILGSTPIGGPIVGFIGEQAGPRWGLALGGVSALIAAGFGAWRFRNK